MDLRLSEEFLVLALNPKTGVFSWWKSSLIKHSVSAALIQELIDRQRLTLEDEHITPTEMEPTNDPVLDAAIKALSKMKKKKKLKHWITKLSKKTKDIQKELIKNLLEHNILKIREDQTWWLLTKNQYEHWSDWQQRRLKGKLRDIIFHDKKGENHHLVLIGLLSACRLTKHIADEKDERRPVRRKAKDITHDNIYRKSVRSIENSTYGNAASGLLSVGISFIKECG